MHEAFVVLRSLLDIYAVGIDDILSFITTKTAMDHDRALRFLEVNDRRSS